MVHRVQVLSLYRGLIRSANKFHNYNFRDFAKRKINYEFGKNKALTDSAIIQSQFQKGVEQLEALKRQVIINSLYPEESSVVEKRMQK
eukprot:gene2689-2863_t